MDDEPSLSLGFMDDDPSIREELACSSFLIVGFLLPEIIFLCSPISNLGSGNIGNNQPEKTKKKPPFLTLTHTWPKTPYIYFSHTCPHSCPKTPINFSFARTQLPPSFLAQYFNTCPKGKQMGKK
jgi:hypothetical protein